MKRVLHPVVIVAIAAISLALAIGTSSATTFSATLVVPTSTPASPHGSGGVIRQYLSSAPDASTGDIAQSALDATIRDSLLERQETAYRIESDRRQTSLTPAHAQTSSEVCGTLLRNPQVDVTEFGDGTGSIDYWVFYSPEVYYDARAGYYNSAFHSLVMVDELDGSDSSVVSPTLDYDAVLQPFYTPPNLTYLEVSYSRLYTNTNSVDIAYTNIAAMDNEGNLVWLIWVPIGEDPEGWDSRYWDLDATDPDPNEALLLGYLSSQPLLFVADFSSNRASPAEVIWIDDIQVTVCYEPPAYAVYLPLTLRNYGSYVGPTCLDREPDSVSDRGSVDVDAICDSRFSQTDTRDYYTLSLSNASNIRLSLFDLPAGTNWDALIYQDVTGYPLKCQIGTLGSADKYKDCTLEPGKSYFVMVNAGKPALPGADSYGLSVTRR